MPIIDEGRKTECAYDDEDSKTVASFDSDSDQNFVVSNEYDSDLILILDIDKTMIYSQCFDSKEKADEYAKRNSSLHCVQVQDLISGENYCTINFRPGLMDFLETIATTFETHIFTAGSAGYAKHIAEILDPNGIYFKQLWSLEHCQKNRSVDGGYIKDLSTLPLGQDDLKRVVLLDDRAVNVFACMGNAILIKQFMDDPNDKELEKIQTFLLNELKNCGKDVRPILEAKAKKENEMLLK